MEKTEITDEELDRAEVAIVKELDVQKKIFEALRPLDPQKRARVMRMFWELYKPYPKQ